MMDCIAEFKLRLFFSKFWILKLWKTVYGLTTMFDEAYNQSEGALNFGQKYKTNINSECNTFGGVILWGQINTDPGQISTASVIISGFNDPVLGILGNVLLKNYISDVMTFSFKFHS